MTISVTHCSLTSVITNFSRTKNVCTVSTGVLTSNMAVSKSNMGLCSSLNFVSLVISTVTLLLLLAGFVRIELKLNDQDAELVAVKRHCTARTQDVSQDGIADVKGKTDYLCVRLFSLLAAQPLLKFPKIYTSLGFSRKESKNNPKGNVGVRRVFIGQNERQKAVWTKNGAFSIPSCLKCLVHVLLPDVDRKTDSQNSKKSSVFRECIPVDR